MNYEDGVGVGGLNPSTRSRFFQTLLFILINPTHTLHFSLCLCTRCSIAAFSLLSLLIFHIPIMYRFASSLASKARSPSYPLLLLFVLFYSCVVWKSKCSFGSQKILQNGSKFDFF